MLKQITKINSTFTKLQTLKYNFATAKNLQFQQDVSIDSRFKADDFLDRRHIGPNQEQIKKQLATVNLSSTQELIKEVIPSHVLDPEWKPTNPEEILPEPLTESQVLEHMRELGNKNKVFKSYLGEGFYDTITPACILRNVFENPGWYTAYTPYQAEISQGRLENLLNFQTMVTELTGLDVSNASLLDEASAAAECVLLAHNVSNGKRKRFFISKNAFPITKQLVKSRAKFLGVEVIEGDEYTYDFQSEAKNLSGVLLQSPDNNGRVHDYTEIFSTVNKQKCLPILSVDLLSLTKVKTPAEMGAQIAIGTSQRLGVPLGFGGPHAGFMASIEKHKRKLPGRIIGISKDAHGNVAYRMALQTREQHIKREKATSNICTAQALLANIAGFYGIYHGPEGLKNISTRINNLATLLAYSLANSGFEIENFDVNKLNEIQFFDTIKINGVDSKGLESYLQEYEINVRVVDDSSVQVSFDEATTLENVYNLIYYTQQFTKKEQITEESFRANLEKVANISINQSLLRSSNFMQQDVFQVYQTETNLMRYMAYLEKKDVSLNKTMIPLGSCTMKLNAVSQLIPVSWPEFGKIHPYVNWNQVQGYAEMTKNITQYLKTLTKFDDFSLQPNSGATGEYAGLLAIKGYLESKGETQRNVCLIPISAHGTNPASAMLAGFKLVIVKADNGQIDVNDLREKAIKHKDNLAALMVTYPSTCGVYEDKIKEVIGIVHENGGQVYMDGANMNAQVGYTSPGYLGADVCHLNLHKTFAIPHGGGGPGLGPIGVKAHLAPFLPGHPYAHSGYGGSSTVTVAQSPFSSASIIPITYSYIRQLGEQGMRSSTDAAILNANYLLQKLKDHFEIVYTRNGRCAHEFIVDIRPFKKIGVNGRDVAKRLQDYSFHAPTVSFPIPDTLMIEPTESEDIEELDRFAEALIQIREEIRKIENGEYSKEDNPLINSPHTQEVIMNEEWNHCYSRQIAAFPLPWVQSRGKYWPPVGRIDEAHGDRVFICKTQQEKIF